jgi:uncharacterized membrane protein
MQNRSSFEGQKVAYGCIIAAIVAVNLWYDYYHPIGLITDAIILAIAIIVLTVRWLRRV